MALSPFIAFGSYMVLRPVSPTAGMAVGSVVMLALALAAGGRRAGFEQA